MSQELPNLDAMTREELLVFWGEWHEASYKQAEKLVGVRPDASKVVEVLACYAITKAVAIGARLKGDTKSSLMYELECQQTYEQLPSDLRW
jgi:hypothetical protein